MKNNIILYSFVAINIFFVIISFTSFEGFSFANEISNFNEIGLHELKSTGILHIVLQDISYVNIILSIFFFFSICSLGEICLKYSPIQFVINKFEGYERNILLYLGAFTIGCIIFVGVYRFLSLNLSIKNLNILFSTYIVFFIFFYLYNIFKIYFHFFSNTKLNLSLISILFILLLLQIYLGGHHIVGDAFYSYGYQKIIKNLLIYEYVPIIGTHYFEELFIFPLIYFLQDFFYSTNLEKTSFQVMWCFQAFGKLSSICLIYICFRFFENSKTKCIFYTLIIFTTNLSAHYFFNPLLYAAGNPSILSIHAYRSSGLILFIFITICYFFRSDKKNLMINNISVIFFLIGTASLGIQHIFLYMLFAIFILNNEIGSIKILKKIQKILQYGFNINIILCLILIFITYTLIGENIELFELAPYILIIPLILSVVNIYSINYSVKSFNQNNFFKLCLITFCFLIILIFFGNIFSFKFLIPTSINNIDLFKLINEKILSNFSYVNKLLTQGIYIYRELIHFEEKNIYELKNICTQRAEIQHSITGVPAYHCSGGLKNLILGLGFVFVVLVFNSYFINKINLKNNKNVSDKYILFLYSMSLFFFIFSLFFNDMIAGDYFVAARSRFLEIATGLIFVVFIIILSKYLNNINHLRVIYLILSLKIILPFFMNFTDEGNWYINQLIENAKFLIIFN